MKLKGQIIILFRGVLFLLIISFLICGCEQINPTNYNVTVEGQFTQFPNKQIVLSEIKLQSANPIDTVVASESGMFYFGMNISEPGFYLVKIDNRNFITLVVYPDEDIRLFAEGKTIAPDYSVTGSNESQLLQTFELTLNQHKTSVDSLMRVYNINQRNPNFQSINKDLSQQYEQIFTAHKNYTVNLIKSHLNTLANLMIVNRRFSQRLVFEEHADFEIFRLIDSALMQLYPDNAHVQNHHERAERIEYEKAAIAWAGRRLEVGKPAPDFKMEMPSGKEINLAAFKGKIVLLYFWAAGDNASRIANKKLVNLYRTYKLDQFEIFAVSLDVYKEMWENAIKTDQLDWIHVSDLVSVHSPVVNLYKVPDELPYFYLLDKKQHIILKGRSTNELEIKLKDIFGH